MIKCECGKWLQKREGLKVHCSCGRIYTPSEQSDIAKIAGRFRHNKRDNRGREKAAICRTNKCGQYDKEQDACLLVIKIGKRKGQKRAGKVSWLYGHPDAECPHNPPMWSIEDGEKADAVGGGTNS